MAAAGEPIVEIVRAGDRDRYLSVLFAPEDKRASLFALYAFNIEIARIRDLIHDPLPGEIRLQWWRDAIVGGNDEAVGHPVVTALLAAIHAHELPRAAFENYLEARIFDLYDDPMPSRADLEGYCGETASAIIQLASLILDPAAAAGNGELAGHAGCAQAIAGLLRLLPIHVRRGQCYFPRDILAAAGTTAEEFVAGTDSAAARRATDAMAALGREHLAVFMASAADMPQSLTSAFLPCALVGTYLDRAADTKRDPFAPSRDIAPLRRYAGIAWRAIRGWRVP